MACNSHIAFETVADIVEFSVYFHHLQGIVIATGEKSEFGEIFKMMQCEEVNLKLVFL